jgi:hypothetical protein
MCLPAPLKPSSLLVSFPDFLFPCLAPLPLQPLKEQVTKPRRAGSIRVFFSSNSAVRNEDIAVTVQQQKEACKILHYAVDVEKFGRATLT